MNERIKEIEQQSYITVKDENSFDCLVFSKQKFAELIVKECAQVVKDSHKYGNPMAKMVVRDASSAVKQHFGVEE